MRSLIFFFIGLLATQQTFAVGSGALANVSGVSSGRTTGMGYAFAGLADDPSAIHFNPAGLTQVKGMQLVVGAGLLPFSVEHTASNTTLGGVSGQKDELKSNVPVAPFLYLTYGKKGSPFTIGIGVNSPFGLITEWKEDSFSKYYATKSKVLMYNINPTIGYRVSEYFSVGAGVDYFNVFDAELNSLVKNVDSGLIPGSPSGDGRKKLSGNGTGWGYNLGLHWKPTDKHSFGFSYRSQVNVIVKGETELTNLQDGTAFAFNGISLGSTFKTGTTTELKFPQSTLFGYGYHPNEKWTIAADYEWVNWNVVQETKFNYEQGSPLPTTIPRDWRNTNNIGAGAEYRAKDWFDLRFGTSIYEQVIPSSTLEASLPEGSRWGLTFGTGFHFGNTTLDLALDHVFFKKRTINNNEETAAYSQDGTFHPTLTAFTISLSQKWGSTQN